MNGHNKGMLKSASPFEIRRNLVRVASGQGRTGPKERIVIFDNGQNLQDISKETGIAMSELLRANGGKAQVKGQKLLIVEGKEKQTNTIAIPSQRKVTVNVIAPYILALFIASYLSLRNRYTLFQASKKATNQITDAESTVTFNSEPKYEAELIDISEVNRNARADDWWFQLPYICVILMDSKEKNEWFSLDMSDEEDKADTNIIAFEEVLNARELNWLLSTEEQYKNKIPSVQIMKPGELLNAAAALDTKVYCLRKQKVPFLDEEGINKIYVEYFKEKKLKI